MANWDKMQANVQIASGAEGTLQKQADIYADSWQAASDRVRAALEAIYDDLISDDFFITLLDGFKLLLNGVDNFIDGIGGLPGVLGLASTIMFKMFGPEMATGIDNLVLKVKGLGNSTKEQMEKVRLDTINAQQAAIKQMSQAYSGESAKSFERLYQIQNELIEKSKDLTEEDKKRAQYLMEQVGYLEQQVLKADELASKKVQVAESQAQDIYGTVISSKAYQNAGKGSKKKNASSQDAADFNNNFLDLFEQTQNARVELEKFNQVRKLLSESVTNDASLEELKNQFNGLTESMGLSQNIIDVVGKAFENCGNDTIQFITGLGKITSVSDNAENAMSNLEKVISHFYRYIPGLKEQFEELKKKVEDAAKSQAVLARTAEDAHRAEKGFSDFLNVFSKTNLTSLGTGFVNFARTLSSSMLAFQSFKGSLESFKSGDITSGIMGMASAVNSFAMVLTSGHPVLASISLIISGLATVLPSMIKSYKDAHDPVAKLAKAQEELNEATKESQEIFNKTQSAYEGYQKAVNVLNECTKGTQEWRDALAEVYSKTIEIIKANPELAGQIKYGKDGMPTNLDEVWSNYKEQSQQEEFATTLANVSIEQSKANEEYIKFLRDLGKTKDKFQQDTRTEIENITANLFGDYYEDSKIGTFEVAFRGGFDEISEEIIKNWEKVYSKYSPVELQKKIREHILKYIEQDNHVTFEFASDELSQYMDEYFERYFTAITKNLNIITQDNETAKQKRTEFEQSFKAAIGVEVSDQSNLGFLSSYLINEYQPQIEKIYTTSDNIAEEIKNLYFGFIKNADDIIYGIQNQISDFSTKEDFMSYFNTGDLNEFSEKFLQNFIKYYPLDDNNYELSLALFDEGFFGGNLELFAKAAGKTIPEFLDYLLNLAESTIETSEKIKSEISKIKDFKGLDSFNLNELIRLRDTSLQIVQNYGKEYFNNITKGLDENALKLIANFDWGKGTWEEFQEQLDNINVGSDKITSNLIEIFNILSNRTASLLGQLRTTTKDVRKTFQGAETGDVFDYENVQKLLYDTLGIDASTIGNLFRVNDEGQAVLIASNEELWAVINGALDEAKAQIDLTAQEERKKFVSKQLELALSIPEEYAKINVGDLKGLGTEDIVKKLDLDEANQKILESFLSTSSDIEDLNAELFNLGTTLAGKDITENTKKFIALLYSLYSDKVAAFQKEAEQSALDAATGADVINLSFDDQLYEIYATQDITTDKAKQDMKAAATLEVNRLGLNYTQDYLPLLSKYLEENDNNYFSAVIAAIKGLTKDPKSGQIRTTVKDSLEKVYGEISETIIDSVLKLAKGLQLEVSDILKNLPEISTGDITADINIAAAATKAGTTSEKITAANRQAQTIFGRDFDLTDFIRPDESGISGWKDEWNKVGFDTLTSLLPALGISDPNEAYEVAYAYGQAAVDGIVDSFGNVIKPDAKELVDIGNYLKQAFYLDETDTQSIIDQSVAIEQAISEANTQLANNFGELGDKVSITADEFGQMMNVLSSDFGPGMEEAEKATNATTEALIAIKEKGLNTKEVIDYTKYLDTLGDRLGEDATASYKVALATKNIQWEKVTKSIKSYIQQIHDGVDSNEEFVKSCGEIAKEFNDVFKTDITSDWVQNNIEWFNKWYEADDELKNDIAETILTLAKLQSLLEEANNSGEVTIQLNDEQFIVKTQEIQDLINYINGQDIVVDAYGKADLTPLFEQLMNNELEAEELAKILAMIGQTSISFEGFDQNVLNEFLSIINDYQGGVIGFAEALSRVQGTLQAVGSFPSGAKITGTGGSRSTMSNIAPARTSSGGGSKSSKSAEQKSDVEKERYHTVQNQLEDLNAEYNAISDAKDRAFGKDKLKMLDAEIAKNDELIEKQKEYLNEIKNYESIDLPVMQATYDQVIGGPAMEFDVRGNISNFDEIQDAMFNKYNEMAASLTSDSEDWEIFEKQYEQLQKYVDKYEETYDLRREEEEKYQEMLDKRTDMMLEKIKMEVELKMDISEDSLEVLEYELKKLDDKAFTAAEAIELLAQKIDNFYEQVGHDREEIDKILAQQLSSAEIVQFHQGDMSVLEGKVFTQDQIDTIREVKDNILDLNESILETKKDIEDQLMKAFDEFDDKIDSTMGKFDHYQDIMENFQNIIDIVGKDLVGVDDAAMDALLQTQIDNAINKVEASKSLFDSIVDQTERVQAALDDAYQRGLADEIEYWEDQMAQMEEKSREAQEELLQNWEDSLQAITNVFEKAVEDAVDKFNKALYGPGGLDALSADLEWQESDKDLHVEDYEKIYELSKLNRDINNTIDDTKNIAGKKKLKDLQDKILQAQKDGVEVSKYDLEYLQKEYELRKAEIELEEARNAKDTVRMNRDTEGNWSYIYTQNVDYVSESQQKYEDALYAMQELTTNYINQTSKDLIDTSKEMEEQLAALRIEDYASIDDYYAAIEDVVNKYQERMAAQEDELNKGIENNKNLYEQDWKNYSEFTGYKISATDDFITSFKDSALGALLDSDSQAADFMGQVNQKLPDFVNNLLLAGDSWYNNVANAFDAAGSSLTGFNEDLDELVSGVQDSSDAAATEVENMANRMEDAMENVINKISAFTSEFKEFFEMIEDNESTIDRMLELLSTLSIPGVTVSQIRGEAPAAGYDTGGYTGAWGPTGKYAVLHEKELVLNADDTANLLASVSLVRALTQQIDQNASYASLGLGNMAGQINYRGNENQDIQQEVYITAEFPNVTSSNEIEQALRNMSNSASQYINRQ